MFSCILRHQRHWCKCWTWYNCIIDFHRKCFSFQLAQGTLHKLNSFTAICRIWFYFLLSSSHQIKCCKWDSCLTASFRIFIYFILTPGHPTQVQLSQYYFYNMFYFILSPDTQFKCCKWQNCLIAVFFYWARTTLLRMSLLILEYVLLYTYPRSPYTGSTSWCLYGLAYHFTIVGTNAIDHCCDSRISYNMSLWHLPYMSLWHQP